MRQYPAPTPATTFRPCSETMEPATGDYLNDHPVGDQRHRKLRRPLQLGLHDFVQRRDRTRPEDDRVRGELRLLRFHEALQRHPDRPVHHLPQPALDERGEGELHRSPVCQRAITPTMFFMRAPYNPASGTAGSNQTAQFCRTCHGGEANEMNGGDTIPTTF